MLNGVVTFQVGKATAVAEEAVGNIRTVRAFAMEGKECELFNKESSEAGELNQHLGFGIGLFQVKTGDSMHGKRDSDFCRSEIIVINSYRVAPTCF